MPKKHTHVPAIVLRIGGAPASMLNMCVLCGAYIKPVIGSGKPIVPWVAITDEEAESIRRRYGK